MTLIGMWQPGKHPVEVEHVFVTAHACEWAAEQAARIAGAGRIPLLTVEPVNGFPGGYTLRDWAWSLERAPGPVYVRYMHEMNGTWYPWAGDPARFKREWARWTEAMPPNVRNVWSPNVIYPGSRPLYDYWVDPTTIDVVAVDGYARNGETPAELFRPTLHQLESLNTASSGGALEPKPAWICETAAPRGRKQARYAGALRAFAEQQGIEAVVWMNEDKAHLGGDERDWTLTKGAARALLGRGK